MKKENAVLLAATKNSSYAIANLVIGIERYSSDVVDSIVVYHDGISDKNLDALRKLSSKIIFVLYLQDDFEQKAKVSAGQNDKFKRYTHMSFCRYEMFDLLDDYNKVLWLDYDILLQGSLQDIFSIDGAAMAPAATPMVKALGKSVSDCPDDYLCLGSCVILISDSIKKEGIADEMYQMTSVFADTALLPDQAIINYVLYRNDIPVHRLSDVYNCPPEWMKAKDSVVVHAAGKDRRFWNELSIQNSYPEWVINNKIWLEAGGEGYSGPVNNRYNVPVGFCNGRSFNTFKILGMVDNVKRTLSGRCNAYVKSGPYDNKIDVDIVDSDGNISSFTLKPKSKYTWKFESNCINVRQDDIFDEHVPEFLLTVVSKL